MLNLRPAFALLILTLLGCGGSGTSSMEPGGGGGPLTLSTGPLVEGAVWQLNRPIDISLDRAVRFSSVNLSNVIVQRLDGGHPVPGTYTLALDATTGQPNPKVIRFQPHCPVDLSELPGLLPNGIDYMLVVRGSDTTSSPLRAMDGTALETTLEVGFSTPFGADPNVLFFDSVPGPPGLVFRGRPGVALDDLGAARFEIGRYQPGLVYMRDNGLGGLSVDPSSQPLVPFGLPLNHYVQRHHQVAFVAEFDQAISIAGDNLARIGLEYFNGGWRSIQCILEPLAVCGPRGSTVRVRPLGTLPPGAPLRVTLDAGFHDLLGQSDPAPRHVEFPLAGTTNQDAQGARVDALFESFQVGGADPGSMEDLTSDLGAPRGYWDRGFISGTETPGGVTRVRSKWYPVGLAGFDGSSLPEAPDFYFTGTDAQGVVLAQGGSVILQQPVLGPFAPAGLQPFAIDVALTDLVELTGLYSAQPSLLTGDRARLRPAAGPSVGILSPIFGTDIVGSEVSLAMGIGCYAPGFNLDCAAWDLAAAFPDPTTARLEIIPQSFEVYTWIHRDVHSIDHRVTITFDAAMAGLSGTVDESTAYSAGAAWTPDVTQFSGTPWDYVRFEVQFELDVSGDGYDPLERSPVLDFIKVPMDFRR